MSTFKQPILATLPEPHHARQDVLTLAQFLTLLREEEDYYDDQQGQTRLMITRLRKIFYDQWGWNSELIRGSASVENRYRVDIVATSETLTVPKDSGKSAGPDSGNQPGETVTVPKSHAKPVRRYNANEYQPKQRLVTYRANDRVYGNTRVGQVPEIYRNDHQEVLLPEGNYCDVAHVLAGLDAANHRQVVSPLPGFLTFLTKLVPHVDSNVDIVTWLGDIASSSGDFLFCYLNTNRQLSLAQEQTFIDLDAPGSDMLGDIDAYVIGQHYPVSADEGPRLTDILADYYLPDQPGARHRQRRFSTFCRAIGLRDWDGTRFANEPHWLGYYRRQLRDNVSFQVFSLTEENLKSIWLSLGIWLNGYPDVLKLDRLLLVFLNALKELIKAEPTDAHDHLKTD
ncbi:MAG: hypothetical protein H7Z72_20585 [Bacteroidetes bacterium]|nr:hypothetical protein [Fibrella sp.]